MDPERIDRPSVACYSPGLVVAQVIAFQNGDLWRHQCYMRAIVRNPATVLSFLIEIGSADFHDVSRMMNTRASLVTQASSAVTTAPRASSVLVRCATLLCFILDSDFFL